MRAWTTHPERFNWTNLKTELLCFLVHVLILAFAIVFCLLLAGCSVTKTIPVETVKEVTRTDTLYINNVQYDSIYVSQDLFTDRSKDTILIRQHDVEFRYKLLRDTVERVKIEVVRDSIPYEVRIETIKEVPRKRNWFDILCYICFGVVLYGIIILFICLFRKTK